LTIVGGLVAAGGVVAAGAVLAAVVLAAQATPPQRPPDAAERALRVLVAAAPRLPQAPAPLSIAPPSRDVALGMVSWVAAAPDGTIDLLQRGDRADPILAIGPDGRVLRGWGRGLFVMPHAIRVDAAGHVWTTDAASSHVRKFTADGRQLLDIAVGGQPSPCRNDFCGTTDVAFAANGHVFVADGYANARVVEYTADGVKVGQWGRPGTGPGEFNLPHSIQIDDAGTVHVADRENGRIQRFDQAGRFLGEWTGFGKTFGLRADGPALWLATQPRAQPNLSPGWLLKVDIASGRLDGWVPSTGNHGMEVMADGTLLMAPGPGLVPQRYRPAR
ncbi:MAG: peptidyl-alpha-hydroxyglycine alpha-amidating lyase family protein, partial [Vicinamibacterales bacterium]